MYVSATAKVNYLYLHYSLNESLYLRYIFSYLGNSAGKYMSCACSTVASDIACNILICC